MFPPLGIKACNHTGRYNAGLTMLKQIIAFASHRQTSYVKRQKLVKM
jgi:hypothetical protein